MTDFARGRKCGGRGANGWSGSRAGRARGVGRFELSQGGKRAARRTRRRSGEENRAGRSCKDPPCLRLCQRGAEEK